MNDQRHRKSEVPQFTEQGALMLIELVESTVGFTLHSAVCEARSRLNIVPLQILQHADIPGDLKSTAFTILRILCGTFRRLPRSCMINEDLKTHEGMPFATRRNTDLWKRVWNGRRVAVKALRFASDDDRGQITRVTSFSGGRSLELTITEIL